MARQVVRRKDATEEFEKQSARANAHAFLETVVVNLENRKLTDAEFRDFIRNSLDGVWWIEYTKPEPPPKPPESKW